MKYIKFFEEIGIDDIPVVGGKNASIGEMIRGLTPQGILIPGGFAVTAGAYRYHLQANKLEEKLKGLLDKVDKHNIPELKKRGAAIRALIEQAPMPTDLADEVAQAYAEMEKRYEKNCGVAVRSSATAEDLPEASFAGQQETFLNVQGSKEVIAACPKAFASLFTDRAISYRIDHGFDHMSVALSIGVQKMIRSDLASSGVMFTLDTETGFKDVIYINGSFGLGEMVVKGVVNPDEFYVHKPLLKKNFKPLLKKRLGKKTIKLIYSDNIEKPVKQVPIEEEKQRHFCLSDDEILLLARQGIQIEEYYSALKGRWLPMDIEWAKDGLDGKLYIVQARPETVHAIKEQTTFFEEYIIRDKEKYQSDILVTGKSVGRKIASGSVRIIATVAGMSQLQAGEILVTDMTDPDWEPIMKIAAGIVTNRGGRTCHAAIVCRELDIPAIIGAVGATETIPDGEQVTIDCSGEEGVIYRGKIPFDIVRTDVATLPKLTVDVMMNIGNADEAFGHALLPNAGVGLARIEFIISSAIQIHPMALVHPEKIEDAADRTRIEELTVGYDDKTAYFVDKLAQEAGTIAAAFYPKPVFIRLSDFKSNEYRNLIAGKYFEPIEENPMLGFRGASRYYHPRYREAFALECLAMKKIRQEMGLDNVKLMVPFVRTINEAVSVLDEMATYGLERGKDGLSIIMMCEIPSNVLLIDDFSKHFDGFSIGSNDLTQFTLAVDRDSELVAPLFDERDPAMIAMLRMAVEGARRNKKYSGICGQAPSDYPEIAQLLVDMGIDSISLMPDTVIKTMMMLGEKRAGS